jgi:branched-chain amino acid transport system ATP-binding protein
MGYTRLHRGEVLWEGKPISRLPAHQRARLGIGWVAQEREIFPSLTVEENLCVAARDGQWTLDRVYGLFPRLRERKGNFGNQLSGGEQQMLAIARALMTNPRLLLLDEPLEGLAPIIVEELAASLANLEGMAVVLVEQHVEIALTLCREAVVIERGRIAHRGPSQELASDDALLERYLGVRAETQ